MTHRHFGIEPRFAQTSSQVRAKASASAVPSAALANIQTVRPALRGIERPVSRHDAVTRVDPSNIPLPSRSIASVGAPLEPLNLSETVKDIIALAFTFLFLGTTGVLFAASMFVLFFVELH